MSVVTVLCKECGEGEFDFYVEPADPSVGYDGVGFSPEFDVDQPCECGEMPPTEKDAERELERRAEAYADDIAEGGDD